MIDDNTSEPDFNLALPVTDDRALKNMGGLCKLGPPAITYVKNAANVISASQPITRSLFNLLANIFLLEYQSKTSHLN